MPLGALDDNDVDDVERDKRTHVFSIVDALERNDVFLPPPEFKKRGTVATTPAQKTNWQKWQESAQQMVEINLSQPHAEEHVELRAWEIIEEMIKIHRMGYRLTSQTMDQKSTCSERIAKALRAIKDYAIVRKKLLEGDRIPDFCIGPAQYASTTVVSLWNNRNREKASSTTAPRNHAPQRMPVATGSVARRYQPRSDLPTKKKKIATKSAGEGTANAEESSVEQGSQTAAPRSRKDDASSLAEEHEGEEVDDGSEADADFEWEEDANDGYALSGRQQNPRHAASTRTEGETPNENPYPFGQDNPIYGNRSLDEGNSSQGRYRQILPSVSSPHRLAAANTYGSGVHHQYTASANDATFPANDTFGRAVVGTGNSLHGMSTTGDSAHEAQVPSGVLSNTVDQPTLGASNAGWPDSGLQHDLVFGKRTNKRHRL